jgi:hypothetical protein
MRRFVSVSLALAAGLALLPGCSDSKPSAASVPANPVAIPKDGPTAGGAGAGGGATKAPSQAANKTPVQ